MKLTRKELLSVNRKTGRESTPLLPNNPPTPFILSLASLTEVKREHSFKNY